MKIALCFSGQSRSFEKGYEYYKRNLLDHYDVDVYIHSWKFPESEKMIELYRPIACQFEEPFVNDSNQRYTNTPNTFKYPPQSTFNMFYSMFECSMLIGQQYDWVIRSRPDYALNVKIPFEELDNTKLYIPNCRMVPERDFGNDQFAFGGWENMLSYMSTYARLDHYYNQGTQFIGEDLMQANLRYNNLCGENLVYVNMNNPFPPGKHNGTWHSLIRDDYEQWPK